MNCSGVTISTLITQPATSVTPWGLRWEGLTPNIFLSNKAVWDPIQWQGMLLYKKKKIKYLITSKLATPNGSYVHRPRLFYICFTSFIIFLSFWGKQRLALEKRREDDKISYLDGLRLESMLFEDFVEPCKTQGHQGFNHYPAKCLIK